MLPLAEAVLDQTASDAPDAAFVAHRDPLTGDPVDALHAPLFRKILHRLEPSAAVASALQALAGAAPPLQHPRA